MKYAFITQHQHEHRVRVMCKVLQVHPSGYYAWRKEPQSARAKENQAITSQVKQSWLESGVIFDYRKIHDDLRDLGMACGDQLIYRLIKKQG